MVGKERHRYTPKFKVQAIQACDEGPTQGIVAEKFRVSQTQVSQWMIKRREIMKKAASKHRKLYKNVE